MLQPHSHHLKYFGASLKNYTTYFGDSSLAPMTNTVELKVNLHCDECIRKILKAIKKIEDIETYDVDKKLNKVIVTGKVTNEEVVKALHKIGKQASSWGDEE